MERDRDVELAKREDERAKIEDNKEIELEQLRHGFENEKLE